MRMRGPARQRGVEVEFLDHAGPDGRSAGAAAPRALEQGRGLAAAMRLDEADDDIDAVGLAGAGRASAWRRSCRRRARRRGRPSACRGLRLPASASSASGSGRLLALGRVAPCQISQGFSASSARLSRSTLTRGSPTIPSRRPSVHASDQRRDIVRPAAPRAAATRATCARGEVRRDVRDRGRSPRPWRASAGTGAGDAGWRAAVRHRPSTRSASLAEVGPRLEPVDAPAL